MFGIALVIGAKYAHKQVDKACGSGGGKFADAFGAIYSTADSIYCDSSITCGCDYSGATLTSGSKTYDQTSGGIKSVQECKDHLESAFADYGITFNSLDDIVSYLDLFGDIEKGYHCSGVCDKEPVYYFSDISKGFPKKKCKGSIQTELIGKVVQGTGIAYIVTGSVLCIIWFVQYGLCCRKKQQPGSGGSKKF